MRYTTHPAEISRLDISLSSQARMHLQKFGNYRPNETPGSVLVLFHADDARVGELHRTTIRTACHQERRQTLEVRKMTHNEHVVGIDLQEVCRTGGIIRGIQSRRVTRPGSRTHTSSKDMRCLLGSFLAAMLNQRNSDSQ